MKKKLKVCNTYLVIAARGKRVVYGLNSFELNMMNNLSNMSLRKHNRNGEAHFLNLEKKRDIKITGTFEHVSLFKLLGKRNKVQGKKAWNSYLDSLKVGREK